MTILENIQATLTAIVGRSYPLVSPEKPTAPYAIYSQITNAPEVTMESAVPIENTRLQIDVFAKTYAEVQTLADQVRSAMLGLNITPISAGDLYEAEVKLFRVTQDFSVWYKK